MNQGKEAHNMPKVETLDPILDEGPIVSIAGTDYRIRRLGFQDVFKVARILGRGIAVLGDQGSNLTPGQAIQVIMASMTANEDEVLDLLASILGVNRKDFADTARFPMEAIVDVAEALANHQDLRAFLAKVQALMERLPEMQNQTQTA
jgi:hypothetical protein